MYPRPHADDERLSPEDREKVISILAIAIAFVLPLAIGTNEVALASVGIALLALIALAIWRTELH